MALEPVLLEEEEPLPETLLLPEEVPLPPTEEPVLAEGALLDSASPT